MVNALILALAASTVTVHLHVDGGGYMRFAKVDKLVYGADATLTIKDGVLVTVDGAVMIPRVHVPVDSNKIWCSLDGHIWAYTGAQKTEVGQVVLAMLPPMAGSGRLFSTTQHASLLNPGDDLAGVIRCSTTAPSAKPQAPDAADPQPATDSTSRMVEIQIAAHTEVDEAELLLSDVAKISGPKDLVSSIKSLDLGRSPEYGLSYPLSAPYINAKLRSIGLKTNQFDLDVPHGAEVTRAGQTISIEQILQAANTAIKERYDVAVPLKADAKVFEMKVPKGDVSVRGEIGQVTDRSVSVIVVAEYNGRRFGSEALVMVPEDDQVGVKAGDQVTIRMISGGATVEVSGTVKVGGWLGGTATVIAQTGTTHTGKVISSNVVEVRL